MFTRMFIITCLLVPIGASAQVDVAYEFEPRELVLGEPTDISVLFRNVSDRDIEFGGAGWDFVADDFLGAITPEYEWNPKVFTRSCWDFVGGANPELALLCHGPGALMPPGGTLLLGTLPANANALGQFEFGVLHRFALDSFLNDLQVDADSTLTTITVVTEPSAVVVLFVGAFVCRSMSSRRRERLHFGGPGR